MKIKDKVLIVEDEQSISNFISMILTANGKSTILNMLSGILPVSGGSIYFDEDNVIAITGAEFAPTVTDSETGEVTELPINRAVRVKKGDVLDCGSARSGLRGYLAVAGGFEPVALAAGLHLAVGEELFDLLAGEGAVGDVHHLHGLSPESLKLTVFKQSGDILAGEVNAQVGLVGAVDLHGLQIGDTAEGRGGGHAVGAELGKNRGQHILQHGEHIVLGGKGHLHVQLIEFAGGAVAPGVLVPEAGGDLEVAVEACGITCGSSISKPW